MSIALIIFIMKFFKRDHVTSNYFVTELKYDVENISSIFHWYDSDNLR